MPYEPSLRNPDQLSDPRAIRLYTVARGVEGVVRYVNSLPGNQSETTMNLGQVSVTTDVEQPSGSTAAPKSEKVLEDKLIPADENALAELERINTAAAAARQKVDLSLGESTS